MISKNNRKEKEHGRSNINSSEYDAWESLQSFFAAANMCTGYVVIRNFEEIGNGTAIISGHEDIDFLCDDVKRFWKDLHIISRYWYKDYIHGKVKIGNLWIKVDTREVGDYYYDTKWEKDILANRRFIDFYYTPNAEDYTYSLLYHSILQKKSMALDYKKKINEFMGNSIEKDEDELLDDLVKWMKQRKYTFTYPKDCMVPLRLSLVDGKKKGRLLWIIRYVMHIPIRGINFVLKKMT